MLHQDRHSQKSMLAEIFLIIQSETMLFYELIIFLISVKFHKRFLRLFFIFLIYGKPIFRDVRWESTLDLYLRE